MAKIRQPKKVGNDIYGVKSDLALKQKLGETGDTEFRHSDHFHKYFHGYTEVRTEKSNGKYQIQRLYTSDWYIQDLSKKKYVLLRILYTALLLLSASMYLWMMTRNDYDGTRSALVAVPGYIVMVGLILLSASLIAYICTKRKMTWWDQYATSGRVRRYSFITAILMWMTSLCIFANICIGVESVGKEMILGIAILVCGLLIFLIYLIERQIPYKEEKNDTVLPKGELHLIL